MELRTILQELNQPARSDDMSRIIELCQQALNMVSQQNQPELWAALKNELANSLVNNPLGNRAENIEQAIFHYQQTLEVRTRQAYPEDWAMTQNNLAIAYKNRICGGRDENIEQAIYHYEQALEVYTRQAYPEDWAITQNNLANAYSDRIRDERAENIEQAISHCEQALEVRTRQANPEDWARTENNLAAAYENRIRGERAENIEQAISHYKHTLEVYIRHPYPEDWAMIQNNLAVAYSNRIRGERAENIEKAIHNYAQALEVYIRQAYPKYWAITQNNLATAYSNRIRGERAENIEKAISHYEQALEVYTRQDYPEDWAMTQNNLANAYSDRIRGERAENIEKAISHYEQALEVYTRQAYPEDWAMTQNNLAIAYSKRIRGERAENIEHDIYYNQQALEVRTGEANPEQWAMTQNNLAIAYSERIRGKRAENIEQAISHYKQALEVYTRQAYPEDWARTENNLAAAYENRIRGERAENIEKAIYHYEQALEIYTRQAYPEDWAMTQNNLATAYQNRILGERAENIEQAISHCEQVLEVRTRQANPEGWAMNQNNLAIAYSERIRGERDKNIEQAIFHYEQALEVYTRQAYPSDCCKAARDLGNLAFEQGRWQLAVEVYEQALDANQILMETAFSRPGQQAEISEIQTLPQRLAYAHLRLNQVEQAVVSLERGRAQLMREALECQRRDLQRLSELGFIENYKRYAAAAREEECLQAISAENHQADWLEKIEHARSEVQAAAKGIREQAGAKYPEYRFFLRCLPFEEIQKQAHDAPLIYLAATSHGGMALIVNGTSVQIEDLPSLTEQALREQVQGPDDDPKLGAYLGAYTTWRRDSRNVECTKTWFTALNNTLCWLGEAVMMPILNTLADAPQAVFIPSGLLGLLPLHAAILPSPLGRDGLGNSYALDKNTFTYAPSAQALYHARLAADRSAESLLAVDNPDGSLHFTEIEMKDVLEHFPGKSTHLRREQASKDAVRQAVGSSHVLHFSTHGTAGWSKAETACLKLADGDLALSDLFDLHLESARLAVLSACETGIPGTRLPDEVVSLPSAWMQAGVPGVISSLWSVDDMSTAILMGRFYDLWRDDGLPAPEALRRAQIWLRDSTTIDLKSTFKNTIEATGVRMNGESAMDFYARIGWEDPHVRPFAHPFYWAAFGYTGV
jgi:CHAT domain-containing protein/tetratricopeptide (TPR) repeat protein